MSISPAWHEPVAGAIVLPRDQIQQHIDELDAQIPKDDASVVIDYYQADRPHYYEITANYIGCLRFGIEMLKAAVIELEHGKADTNISLEYMSVPRWSFPVKICRREDVVGHLDREFAAMRATWRFKLRALSASILGPVSGILVVLCMVIGLLKIVSWTWHLLF